MASDDFDTVFRSEASANICKSITSPDGRRFARYQTKEIIKNAERDDPDPAIPPLSFEVFSGYPFFSNIDFDNPTAIEPAMRPHVAALESRGGIIRISRDPRHLFDFTLAMARDGMLTKQSQAFTWDVARDAVAFFVKHRRRLREANFSPRGLVEIAKERKRDPDHWATTLESSMLGPRDVRDFDITGFQTGLTKAPSVPHHAEAQMGAEDETGTKAATRGAKGHYPTFADGNRCYRDYQPHVSSRRRKKPAKNIRGGR